MKDIELSKKYTDILTSLVKEIRYGKSRDEIDRAAKELIDFHATLKDKTVTYTDIEVEYEGVGLDVWGEVFPDES